MAEGDTSILGQFSDEFNQVAATLLRKLGDRETDDFSVHLRSNPKLGFFERLPDGIDGGGIPWLNDQQARFRGGDSSQLFESHG